MAFVLLHVLLGQAASVRETLPTDAVSVTLSCVAEFHACASVCASPIGIATSLHAGAPPAVQRRICHTGCAKVSALCQQPYLPAFQQPSIQAAGTFKTFSDALGEPFLPFGFYQYSLGDRNPLDARLPAEEALHGMTLTAPYASTATPDAAWWSSMANFLDECSANGFYVNFQLIAFESLGNDAATLANLTKQITTFKDHPAILAWYLADEPGGQGIPPATLKPKYDAVRAADPGGKPVSMVFCTTQASEYFAILDLVMVDPYPIPSSSAATVSSALDRVIALGKPVLMVPQAFGGGENWARGPSRQEERLMTYLGFMSGAIGIQYFVRNPEGGFPYAPAAWSTIRIVAQESRELAPALLSGTPANVSVAAPVSGGVTPSSALCVSSVRVKAWSVGGWGEAGEVVVLAANTANSDGQACAYTVTVDASASAPASASGDDVSCAVTLMFENRALSVNVKRYAGTITFTDSLRGFGTSAYRVACVAESTKVRDRQRSSGANLVYNGDYEIAVNAATPDGHYVTQPSNTTLGFGFFFGEYRSRAPGFGTQPTAGRASLRLTAPAALTSTSLSPYTVHGIVAKGAYALSIWVRGALGGETFELRPSTSIWSITNASVTVSSEGVVVVTATTKWVRTTVHLTAASDMKTVCTYGCRSWLSYALTSKGNVWVDDLSLVAA